jgi:hypothetical protein
MDGIIIDNIFYEEISTCGNSPIKQISEMFPHQVYEGYIHTDYLAIAPFAEKDRIVFDSDEYLKNVVGYLPNCLSIINSGAWKTSFSDYFVCRSGIPSGVSLDAVCTFIILWFFAYLIIEKIIHDLTFDPLKDSLEKKSSGYRSPKLITRYVSILHSLFVAASSTLYLLSYMSPETWAVLQSAVIAYCVYDVLINFEDPEKYNISRLMIFHHFILFYFSYIVFPHYPILVSIGYLSEWSNIPLHISYHIIHTPHIAYRKIFVMFKTLTIVSFFILRVVNFTYLIYISLTMGFVNIENFTTGIYHVPHILLAVCLSAMNILWFIKICILAIKV